MGADGTRSTIALDVDTDLLEQTSLEVRRCAEPLVGVADQAHGWAVRLGDPRVEEALGQFVGAWGGAARELAGQAVRMADTFDAIATLFAAAEATSTRTFTRLGNAE